MRTLCLAHEKGMGKKDRGRGRYRPKERRGGNDRREKLKEVKRNLTLYSFANLKDLRLFIRHVSYYLYVAATT